MTPKPQKSTQHRRSTAKPKEDPRKVCTDEELQGLEEMISEKFEWTHSPRRFQVDAIRAQLKGLDVVVHAGTGLGKTAIAAGPHVHPSARGKVTLMVSPLIALHDEMVETFKNEYKLTATAINSSNGGCSPDKLKRIVAGEWQVVMISPELLLSRRFITNVLKNPEFRSKVISIFVDEAHVISHWGSGFRKKYGELGIIRSFIPKSTSIVAVSATLPPRVRRDVIRVLRYHPQQYVSIDVGNDRPNVTIVVRGIQHPLNSYADLDFIVEDLANDRNQIPKTFIYCDNIAMGTEIIDHLMTLLPENLRHDGIIRPYNACFSKDYRKAVRIKFKSGEVRILVCTDAAGMGCNVPDVDLVVQWKLPKSMSAFVQRAGRAARASGRQGMAVLLAEPSAYTTFLDKQGSKVINEKAGKGKKGKGVQERTQSKAKKDYSIARGYLRGSAGGKHDAILVKDCSTIDEESIDEGLYAFVQSGTCRRTILTIIYQNQPACPTGPCCDICDPSLLNKTRPGTFEKPRRGKAFKVGQPCLETVDRLHEWRSKIKKQDYAYSMLNTTSILPDSVVQTIASVGTIENRQALSTVLAGEWGLEDKCGHALFSFISNLESPSFVPLPPKKRSTAEKRKNNGDEDGEGENGGENESKGKKKRKSAHEISQLPVCLTPTHNTFETNFEATNYSHSTSPRTMRTYQLEGSWVQWISRSSMQMEDENIVDNNGVD